MKKRYTKEEFENLDFDTKCEILEILLTDDYFKGLTDINFYLPVGFIGKIGEPLPETPPEIKIIEDEKFEQLIEKLSIKLFENKDDIEVNMDTE